MISSFVFKDHFHEEIYLLLHLYYAWTETETFLKDLIIYCKQEKKKKAIW